MDRYRDSLARYDYQEKERRLLGPPAEGLGPIGIELRLPKQASTAPSTPVAIGKVIKFETDPDVAKRSKAARPLTVVLFVSRKTKETELLDHGAIASQILEARNEWAGPDLQVTPGMPLELTSRTLRYGPELRKGQEQMQVLRLARLDEYVSSGSAPQPRERGAGSATSGAEMYGWEFFFLEDSTDSPTARAAVGFGFPDADYTDANLQLADAITMSVTSLRFIPLETAAPVEGEETEAPAGESDTPKAAPPAASPARRGG
jgi:hypothetical protein